MVESHPRTVVLIMVDQLAAMWLEVAIRDNIVDLPNFSAMQAEGLTFRNAFTPNPARPTSCPSLPRCPRPPGSPIEHSNSSPRRATKTCSHRSATSNHITPSPPPLVRL